MERLNRHISTVRLGKDLVLPAHALATHVVAALGMRGSGKSSAMMLAAEGLLERGVQVVVLDYVGVWFGLRLKPDGKTPSGLKIAILGGRHGDISLVPGAGRHVAEALAQSGSSAILDVSKFSKGERVRFAADFGEAFLAAKKDHPGPVFLILEEAQRYVPQVIRFADPNVSRCLGAFEEIGEVGRNFGVGLGLISLRPQKINKDVLNLAELLLAFQTNGVAERKAISEWVQEKGAEGRGDVAGELPSLPRGTALVWSPSTFKLYGKFALDRKKTYDASATPEQARAEVTVKPLDLASLEQAMASVVVEAKANDPKALRARVAELERELARRPAAGTPATPAPAKVVEQRPLIATADVARLERLVAELRAGEEAFAARLEGDHGLLAETLQAFAKKTDDRRAAVAKLQEGLTVAISDLARLASARPPTPEPRPRAAAVEVPTPATSNGTRVPAPRPRPSSDPGGLTKCARALLSVIVQRGAANASQVSTLSGYKRTSSTFDNGMSELRVKGLIAGSRERLTPTDAGREAIGTTEPLPSGRALLDYWVGRLTRAEGAVLKVVYDAGSIGRAELSERSGYRASSSTFDNALSGLRVLDLITGERGGDVSIAPVFAE